MKVSIILPTLNEAENIILLIEKIYNYIPSVFEIIVVDDNSSDETARIVTDWSKNNPSFRVLVEKRLKDHGLTNSLKHGISLAGGDVIAWMDCDFSMPPEFLSRLLYGINQGYHIAVGSRFVRGGSFKKNTQGTPDSPVAVFLSRLMNYSIQFLLDHSFKDYTSGFVAVRREVFEEITLRGDYGEYFIDFIFKAKLKGFKIIEMPYICLPRLKGESKTGQNLGQLIKRGWGYVITALRLRLQNIFVKPAPVRDTIVNYDRRDNYGKIEIAPLEETQIPFVAGLHHQLLYSTLSSRLGIPFLEDLYTALFKDKHSKCWIAVQNNDVVGFISVTLNLHKTKAFVSGNMLWRDRFTAFFSIISNFNNFCKFIKNNFFHLYCSKYGNPFPYIVTLGVASNIQGKGLAAQLMKQAKDFFRQNQVCAYFVDVLSDNGKAKKFYEKEKFKKIADLFGNALFRYEDKL